MAPSRQTPQLVLATHHNKSPGHPDTAQSATLPNSPKSARIYSPDTHLHAAPPTRMSHKPIFAPMPSVTIPDGAPSDLGLSEASWEHYHYPSRSRTYQSRLLPSVLPLAVANVVSANHHRVIISAMQVVIADAASQFELDPIPLAKSVRGHSS